MNEGIIQSFGFILRPSRDFTIPGRCQCFSHDNPAGITEGALRIVHEYNACMHNVIVKPGLPDWHFCRQIPEMLCFLGLVGARKFIWQLGALLPAEMCPLKYNNYIPLSFI